MAKAQTHTHPDQHEPLKFEELFLTQEEHFTIRTLSQILKWTESLVRGKEVPHSGYMKKDKKTKEEKQLEHASTYKILNSFCQAINRGGSEVIALLPGPFTGAELTVFSATSTSTENESDETQDLYFTRNPQQNEFPRARAEAIKYSVDFASYGVPSGFTNDPFGTYLDLVKEYSFKIPFALVPHLALTLLKHAHTQSSKQAGKHAFDNFGLLTMCLGFPRLSARFDLGIKSRNFFQVIMLLDGSPPTSEDFGYLAERLQDQDADSYALGDSMKDKTFTPVQRDLISQFLRIQLITADAPLPQKFDARGRRFLATVLCSLLKLFQDKVKKARDSQPSRNRTTPFNRESYEIAMMSLLKLNQGLWLFFTRFRDQIKEILAWVENVCGLRNATLINTYSEHGDQDILSSSPAPPSDPDTPPAAEQVSQPSTPTSGIEQGVVSPRTPSPSSDIVSSPPSIGALSPSAPRDQPLELTALDDLTDDEANAEEVIAICAIEENPRSGWHDTCFRWLELVITHYEAIRNVHIWSPSRSSSIAKSLKRLVPRAEIHTLEVKSSYADQRMRSISEVLEELEESRVEPEVAESLREWLERYTHEGIQAARLIGIRPHVDAQSKWDDPKFKGTMHCETIMLTLHALSIKGIFPASTASARAISDCLKSRDIIVPPEIIDRFKTIGNILAVSKRCCPACNSVVSAIRDYQRSSRRITYPGYHTVWFPIALPPWTPRKIGQILLDTLWKAVQERAERVHDVVEAGKKVRCKTPSDASHEDIEVEPYDTEQISPPRDHVLQYQDTPSWSTQNEDEDQQAGDETPRPFKRTMPILLAPGAVEPPTSPKRSRNVSPGDLETESLLSPTKKTRK
ncbi:uncharacterized protein PV07_08698 [Cladophialophora immunda]|uniref:Uncharacterized protein n=1 Tax=Cladophialophora immunda TaxID=569365 RepID=A0A0D2AKQ1_9EURO|nr:uncharacterized protein PV07_08698 [Cladophialophora immunda]KIW25532.1 hypothetical protein PV07_08698 [Cladophialophora immunda]